MNSHKGGWARAALLIAMLLCGPAQAATPPAAGQQKPGKHAPRLWQVSVKGGMPLFQIHGARFGWHWFGFFDKPGYCDQHIVWVEWTSKKATPAELKKIPSAHLEITAAGVTVPADVPLSPAMPFAPGVTGFAMTNFGFNDHFLDLLQHAKSIKVRITGPRALLRLLDTTGDSYTVRGFPAARKRARAMCANQGKPVPDFADYKVTQVDKGRHGKVKLERDDDPKFRKALIAAGKQPVNFAGHYIIFHYSCGLGAVCASVLDAVSGDVVAGYPDAYDLIDDPHAVFSDDYRADSSLAIITGESGQTETPLTTHCYNFVNEAFKEIGCN